MDQKQRFVVLAESGEYTISELCQRFGISRDSGHRWLKRFRASGMGGLEPLEQCPPRRGQSHQYRTIDAWWLLNRAIELDDPGQMSLAAKLLTDYEQNDVIVETWNKLDGILPHTVISDTFSCLAKNILPGGDNFTTAVPGGNLADTNDRWKWIHDGVGGSPNGIMGRWGSMGIVGRFPFVNATLKTDAERFELSLGEVWVNDDQDVP